MVIKDFWLVGWLVGWFYGITNIFGLNKAKVFLQVII